MIMRKKNLILIQHEMCVQILIFLTIITNITIDFLNITILPQNGTLVI